jgi:hypothetical protein
LIPTNQKRADAESELEEAIAQLPAETDVWNHLPAFKHFAARLFNIAAEAQLRNGTPDRGFLDELVAKVVDAVLSEGADPDEWRRFARKGSQYPFERRALRERLRQFLVGNQLLYWLRRYSLVAETAGEVAPKVTAVEPAIAQPDDEVTRSQAVETPGSETQEDRARRRQHILDPALRAKGWAVYRWEKEAGVASKVGQRYYDGDTERLSAESERKLSEALGISLPL